MFYSGVFASAAMADLKIKDDRRKKLDRAISDAQNDLILTESKAERTRDKETGDLTALTTGNPWNTPVPLQGADWGGNATSGAGLSTPTSPDKLSRSQRRAARNDAKGKYSLKVAQGWSRMARRRKESPHLRLADELIRHISQMQSGRVDSGYDHAPINYAEAMNQETERELSSLLEHFQTTRSSTGLGEDHRRDDTSSAQGKPRHDDSDLRESLRSLLDDWDRDWVKNDIILVKVCYRLLIFNAPITADIYDLLIRQFILAQRCTWLEIALDALFESRERPRSSTLRAIVDYYTTTDKNRALSSFLQRAQRSDGDLLSRIGSIAAEKRPVQCGTAETDDRGVGRAPSPRSDYDVFSEITDRVLQSKGLMAALDFHQRMLSAGWELSLRMLTKLLGGCASTGDWYHGSIIWFHIKGLFCGRPGDDDEGRLAYFWMLHLCRATDNWDHFEHIFREAVACGVEAIPITHISPPRPSLTIRFDSHALIFRHPADVDAEVWYLDIFQQRVTRIQWGLGYIAKRTWDLAADVFTDEEAWARWRQKLYDSLDAYDSKMEDIDHSLDYLAVDPHGEVAEKVSDWPQEMIDQREATMESISTAVRVPAVHVKGSATESPESTPLEGASDPSVSKPPGGSSAHQTGSNEQITNGTVLMPGLKGPYHGRTGAILAPFEVNPAMTSLHPGMN